jgi:hypothetical protein
MSNFLGFTKEIETLVEFLSNKCVRSFKKKNDIKIIKHFYDYRQEEDKYLNIEIVLERFELEVLANYDTVDNKLSIYLKNFRTASKKYFKRILYHEFAHILDPKVNTERLFSRMEYPGKDTILIEMDAYCKELEFIIKGLIKRNNKKQIVAIGEWLKRPDAFLHHLNVFEPCNTFIFDCYKNEETTRKIKTRIYDFLYN